MAARAPRRAKATEKSIVAVCVVCLSVVLRLCGYIIGGAVYYKCEQARLGLGL